MPVPIPFPAAHPATRPNYVSGQSFFQSNKTAGSSGQWVNLAAFPEPAPGFLGSTSRNMLYSPGYQNFDMSLGKTFQHALQRTPPVTNPV